MREFVFAYYVLELKNALKKRTANETVIGHLYGLVAIPANLDGKGGRTIDCPKTTGNDIVHRRANAHRDIQAHSRDPEVVDGIGDRFKTTFSKLIHPSKLPTYLDSLREGVAESSLHAEIKAELLALCENEEPWDFLGRSFLEVVLINNISAEPENLRSDSKSLNNINVSSRFPARPHVEAPNEPSHEEGYFIDALMEAYGQAEGIEEFDLDRLDDFPKRKGDFNRNRECFYAAEEVRRGARDIYSDEENDQFEVLKEEIRDGVDILYYSDYGSGVERMSHVLEAATRLPIEKSCLGRDTNWVGGKEKKGTCHFIVNDRIWPGWVSTGE